MTEHKRAMCAEICGKGIGALKYQTYVWGKQKRSFEHVTTQKTTFPHFLWGKKKDDDKE